MSEKVGMKNYKLNSDQGFQYTSYQYYCLTKEYNILPSMSRKENL